MPPSPFSPLAFIHHLQSLLPSAHPSLHTSLLQPSLCSLRPLLPSLPANELAGIAFYLSQLECWHVPTWRLIEMQVARTPITEEMTIPALVRTIEAFGAMGGSEGEVQNREALIRMEMTLKSVLGTHKTVQTGVALMSPDDLASVVWTMGTSLTGTNALYRDLESLYMREIAPMPGLTLETLSKVLWTYVYLGVETERLVQAVAKSLGGPVDWGEEWGARLLWALEATRYKGVYQRQLISYTC